MCLPSPIFHNGDYMNILAVDQARNGGWSIYNYVTKELVTYGTFSFPDNKYDFSKAVQYIEEIVSILIDAYDVDAVFIEDIQFQTSVKVFKRLAHLQGVLINLFEKNEYLYDIVSPSQWQGFCSARGRTSKEIKADITSLDASGKKKSKMLSIQFIKDKFGIETTNDNLADAICIGYYVVNNIEIRTRQAP